MREEATVRRNPGWTWALVLAAVVGAASASVNGRSAGTTKNSAGNNSATGPATARFPAVRERTYQMNARVRPLLFWIRKNDVGDGRITWRAKDGAGRGYELLVGSDPGRAPRRINRWGFIREELSAADANVLGVMKKSKEQSVKEAEQELAREGEGGFVFQAIRSRVSADRADAGVVTYRSETDLTYRDLDPLLNRVTALEGPRLTTALPANTSPGLLFAVADMLDEIMKRGVPPRGSVALPQPRHYVYYRTLYDLKVRSLERTADPHASDRQLLDADFEILNRTTRKTTRFSIVFAPTGPAAGVPVKIMFRPRWWFEVELILRQEQHASR